MPGRPGFTPLLPPRRGRPISTGEDIDDSSQCLGVPTVGRGATTEYSVLGKLLADLTECSRDGSVACWRGWIGERPHRVQAWYVQVRTARRKIVTHAEDLGEAMKDALIALTVKS
jgi:hypothetical protein